ncbi:MAG: hypothetical protein IJZ22_03370 [Bacteroidaceae bacterium]|nr:hypothetical protein [Bacteroidaceae bacterium]
MKKTVLSMALILSATIAFGQELTKAQIKAQKREAKALMVVAKDAEKLIVENPSAALNNIQACVNSPLVNNDPYVWFIAAKSRKAIVEKDNAARAAGAQIDMDKFYADCGQLIYELEKCDSLDNAPNAKGKVAPKYAEFIKEGLYENRNQMYNGGSYYYNKGNYAESYNQFAKFVSLTEHHLLKDVITPAEKVYNVNAAYNAVLCGMRLEDYQKVLAFADVALADESKAGNIYRYKATAYETLGDTVKWIELLKDGVVKFPNDPFFYQTLIQHYDTAGDKGALDTLADELIASNPSNPLFVYLKGYIAQQQNDMDTAFEWYKKTLEIDPNYVNALRNVALSYVGKAQEYSTKQSSVRLDRAQIKKDKEIINGYFKEALPYFEKLREIAPDKKELWLNGLSQCYYNLNMEDKMKEIEALAQ